MPRGRRRKPFAIKLKQSTLYTFSTVILFIIAGIIILSFSRQGPFLTKLFLIFNHYFGWGVLFLPFLLMVAGLMLSRLPWRLAHPNVLVGGLLLMLSSTALGRSGQIGFEVWQNLAFLITNVGAFLALMGFVFIALVVTFNTSLEEMFIFLSKIFSGLRKVATGSQLNTKRAPFQIKDQRMMERNNLRIYPESLKQVPVLSGQEASKNPIKSLSAEGQVWEYPPLSLLADNISGKADRGDIKKNAQKIEECLDSFGISASVAEVNPGPAVTQYALNIPLGTKLSKITTLSNDLAMALAAPTGQIRIEAPIPGRSLVGVEVPNHSLEVVGLKQMLSSEQMKRSKSKLSVALGLNVAGDPVIADIGKMPHALIAGQTGSGKSVCIHSFITTLLFRASPSELKLILIDPKRVELPVYDGIPHLITPVIVDANKVLSVLEWTLHEMDERYKKFAEVGAKNIEAYNELAGFMAMSYLVIIIDEFATIISIAPAEVEDRICRLAQMARATGIHLIISTQSPRVDVITGLIKANISCRIAFNVSSQIDSRVILDTAGAEKLLGRGDMLFVPPDQARPARIQGTFVSDGEIRKLIEFLKRSGIPPAYTEEVTKMPIKGQNVGLQDGGEQDELFDDAVQIVCNADRASASLLQRKLKVGYARAARILDQMEKVGIVGPSEGAKAREVFNQNAQNYLASKTAQQ
jgi:DNA segregation ATPase FtsK/SpoIIIE, S-DNA-T family